MYVGVGENGVNVVSVVSVMDNDVVVVSPVLQLVSNIIKNIIIPKFLIFTMCSPDID